MLDKKDMKILEVLKEDARLSTQKISKKTGIPITTVHHRIKKLVEDKVIKRFTVDVDQKALDRNLLSIVLITTDNAYCKQNNVTHSMLADVIKKNPLVESAVTITGETDLLVRVRVKDINQLDDFLIKYLRPLNGILKTNTKIVLQEVL